MRNPMVRRRRTVGLSFLLSLVSVLVLPVAGWAQDYVSGPGLGIAIPDDDYDGSLGSMASDTIFVDLDGTDWVVAVTVEVAVDHTWVGDLVFKLESPGGTVVTLAHRPGLDAVLDDGEGCCGSAANLADAFPILFSDTAPSGAWAEQMGSIGGEPIGDPGTGSPDNYIPDADDLSVDVGGPLLDSLGALAGEQAAGDWTLYIGDGHVIDTGVLDGWTLRLVTDTPGCPGGSLYSQPPNVPFAWPSDVEWGWTLYENFPVPAGELSEPVCDVHWWGLYADVGPCIETSNAFQISFYEDNGGQPGDEVCSYAVEATRTDTGLRFDGVFPIYEFSADLPSCCPLGSGWVSIVAEAGDPGCSFWWSLSWFGDRGCLFDDGGSLNFFGVDTGLCLTTSPDGDGDLVPDSRDACPGTASGDPVDADGCSTADDDGDGVLNDQDDCADTPRCAEVDSDGCPSDSDGDGVVDGCDDCPNTPSCATNIDADGCAIDSDGDGNVDGCEPPAQSCCGATGPVAPLGLAVGLLLLGRFAGWRNARRR